MTDPETQGAYAYMEGCFDRFVFAVLLIACTVAFVWWKL